jgi:hypothetical protein
MSLHQQKCRMDYRVSSPDSLGVSALATKMSDAFLSERTNHDVTTPYHQAE